MGNQKDFLLMLLFDNHHQEATYELVRDRFQSIIRFYAIVVARQLLNGALFISSWRVED